MEGSGGEGCPSEPELPEELDIAVVFPSPPVLPTVVLEESMCWCCNALYPADEGLADEDPMLLLYPAPQLEEGLDADGEEEDGPRCVDAEAVG